MNSLYEQATNETIIRCDNCSSIAVISGHATSSLIQDGWKIKHIGSKRCYFCCCECKAEYEGEYYIK